MDLHKTAPSMAVLIQFTARLGTLWCWLAIATGHALLLALGSLALWAAQVSPQAVADLGSTLLASRWIAALSLVFGGSLLGFWIWAMRKLARAMHGRIRKFVVS